jgi:hypothetical protein
MVPEVGLEPTWSCPRQILSLVRIPISPLRRNFDDKVWKEDGQGRAISTGVSNSAMEFQISNFKFERLKAET